MAGRSNRNYFTSPPGVASGSTSVTRNRQTGTSYAIQTTDLAAIVEIQNSTANTIVALTIPQAGSVGFLDGWFTTIKNLGTNYAQLTPTTSTLENANIVLIPPGYAIKFYSDGVNYWIMEPGVQSYTTFFSTFGHDNDITVTGTSTAIMDAANSVIGATIELRFPKYLKHTNARVATGVAASTGAYGLYDGNGNKIFSTGAFATATSNQQITFTLASTWLLLPGIYKTAWTDTSTTVTFYPDNGQNVGSSATIFWQANTVKFWKAANAAVAGDLPATTGVITSITATLPMGSCVPAIFFEN